MDSSAELLDEACGSANTCSKLSPNDSHWNGGSANVTHWPHVIGVDSSWQEGL